MKDVLAEVAEKNRRRFYQIGVVLRAVTVSKIEGRLVLEAQTWHPLVKRPFSSMVVNDEGRPVAQTRITYQHPNEHASAVLGAAQSHLDDLWRQLAPKTFGVVECIETGLFGHVRFADPKSGHTVVVDVDNLIQLSTNNVHRDVITPATQDLVRTALAEVDRRTAWQGALAVAANVVADRRAR